MKKFTFTLSSVALLLANSALSQGFVNLDFEHPRLPLNPDFNFISASNGIPNWTAYLDDTPQGFIAYDTLSLGGALVILEDTNSSSLGPFPIQGKYSVLLQGAFSLGGSTNASIGQTGQIPVGSLSLLLFVASNYGQFLASFNGQNIPLIQTGATANYVIMGGNISAFAGQTGQLLFTTPFQSGALIDNIQFSTSGIPEPGTLVLAGIGGLILAAKICKRSAP